MLNQRFIVAGGAPMAEVVTLELPDEVAYRAREAAQRTGRLFEYVLTEWLGRGAASEDATRTLQGAAYPIHTPYGNEAAAQILLDALSVTGRTDTGDNA
jgi:hypothetical protein